MSDTIVTSKGQITIPKHIRDRQGISAGTRLDVTERGDDIVLRRSTRARPAGEDAALDSFLERVRGSMRLPAGTDGYMELLRGE